MNDAGKTDSMLNTTVKRSYKKLFDFQKTILRNQHLIVVLLIHV